MVECAEVKYDAVTKGITITLGETTINMTVNDPNAMVNGVEVVLDAPPTVIEGRTLVPVRFISEAFDCEVLWDAATRTVTIIKDYLP